MKVKRAQVNRFDRSDFLRFAVRCSRIMGLRRTI